MNGMESRTTRRRMSIHRIRTIVMVGVSSVLCAHALAAGAAQENGSTRSGDDSLESRLTALSPNEPMDYFLLGEDCADTGDAVLATRLFVLAAHLDLERLGRSACLALAELARREEDVDRVARLEAMASMFAGSDANPVEMKGTASNPERRRAGALIASMFGFYRTGNGARALKALEQDHQSFALLARYERGIGFVSDALTYCRNHPRCEQCSNEMVIKDPQWVGLNRDRGVNRPFIRPSEDSYVVCPRLQTHTPNLSGDDVQRMLEIESALVLGQDSSWGARTILDQGEPKPVLEPASLVSMFEIDITHTVYRNGAWVTP